LGGQKTRQGHGQPAETKISYLMDVLAHVCVWLCRHHVIIAQLKGSHYYLNENVNATASVPVCWERNRKLQAKDVGIYDKSPGNVLLTETPNTQNRTHTQGP